MCTFTDAWKRANIPNEAFTNPRIDEKDLEIYYPKSKKTHTITNKGAQIFRVKKYMRPWSAIRESFIRAVMVDCIHDFRPVSADRAECRKCLQSRDFAQPAKRPNAFHAHPFACHDCKKPFSCDEAPGWCQECLDKAAASADSTLYGIKRGRIPGSDDCHCVSILNGHENGCAFKRD